MGGRRASWIVGADTANGVGIIFRDMFGYQIKEDTWVLLCSKWITVNTLQQGDYMRGGNAQHNAMLYMKDDAYNSALQNVVCVRTVFHFVHLWQRQARRKMLKRHARHVLLLLWSKKLPLSIGYQIHECFRSNAKPQMQRPWLAPATGINGILASMDCTGLFEMD